MGLQAEEQGVLEVMFNRIQQVGEEQVELVMVTLVRQELLMLQMTKVMVDREEVVVVQAHLPMVVTVVQEVFQAEEAVEAEQLKMILVILVLAVLEPGEKLEYTLGKVHTRQIYLFKIQ